MIDSNLAARSHPHSCTDVSGTALKIFECASAAAQLLDLIHRAVHLSLDESTLIAEAISKLEPVIPWEEDTARDI